MIQDFIFSGRVSLAVSWYLKFTPSSIFDNEVTLHQQFIISYIPVIIYLKKLRVSMGDYIGGLEGCLLILQARSE